MHLNRIIFVGLGCAVLLCALSSADQTTDPPDDDDYTDSDYEEETEDDDTDDGDNTYDNLGEVSTLLTVVAEDLTGTTMFMLGDFEDETEATTEKAETEASLPKSSSPTSSSTTATTTVQPSSSQSSQSSSSAVTSSTSSAPEGKDRHISYIAPSSDQHLKAAPQSLAEHSPAQSASSNHPDKMQSATTTTEKSTTATTTTEKSSLSPPSSTTSLKTQARVTPSMKPFSPDKGVSTPTPNSSLHYDRTFSAKILLQTTTLPTKKSMESPQKETKEKKNKVKKQRKVKSANVSPEPLMGDITTTEDPDDEEDTDSEMPADKLKPKGNRNKSKRQTAVGPAGPQGPKGPPGPQGPRGERGPPGNCSCEGQSAAGPTMRMQAAVTAVLTKHFGPAKDVIVPFDLELIDSADNYDNVSGVFFCSIPGTYVISLYLMSHPGSKVNARIFVNSRPVAALWADDNKASGFYPSSSIQTISRLAFGDQVYVMLVDGGYGESWVHANYNVFTLFLLYEDEFF